jgi:disulfide bond formation protein DsbB
MNMSMNLTLRQLYVTMLLFILVLIGAALILQYGFHWQPCSLCMLDRAILYAMAGLFVIAWIHNPNKIGGWIYATLGLLLSLAGMAVSARHLWLIQLPVDQVPSCTPGLDYLLETLPLKEALVTVLKGSGECSKQPGYFLKLSLPAWTMMAFVVLAMGNVFALTRKNRK